MQSLASSCMYIRAFLNVFSFFFFCAYVKLLSFFFFFLEIALVRYSAKRVKNHGGHIHDLHLSDTIQKGAKKQRAFCKPYPLLDAQAGSRARNE